MNYKNLKFDFANHRGVTLVELMVALALGLVISAAVIQTYFSTSQTNRVTQGVSRIQENARFAHYFLTKDLREAGFQSCIGTIRNKLNGSADDFIPSKRPIFVWNYSDTDSNNTEFELTAKDTDLVLPGAGNWDTAIPNFMEGQVVAGSDVLNFKSLRKLDVQLSVSNTLNNNTLDITNAHDIEMNSILIVGDCLDADLFQNFVLGTGSPNSFTASRRGGANPGNRSANPIWGKVHGPNSDVFAVIQTYYYIGEGASGLPSLFRFQTTLTPAAITSAIFTANTQELVEGVETLQVLLGEDTDVTNDGKPNRYISANQVNDWDDIVSSRVGMLLRSPNTASDLDQIDNYMLLDNISFTHDGDDRLLRYAVNSTVKIRNKGLSNSPEAFVCDAGNCP